MSGLLWPRRAKFVEKVSEIEAEYISSEKDITAMYGTACSASPAFEAV